MTVPLYADWEAIPWEKRVYFFPVVARILDTETNDETGQVTRKFQIFRDSWNGAKSIEDEDGEMIKITSYDPRYFEGLELLEEFPTVLASWVLNKDKRNPPPS